MGIGIRGALESLAGHDGISEDECNGPSHEEEVDAMTKYLISFPSAAMAFLGEDLQAVSDATHAVVQEAKNAGVWVFGGGIDESTPPVMVDGDGTVRKVHCILPLRAGGTRFPLRPCQLGRSSNHR